MRLMENKINVFEINTERGRFSHVLQQTLACTYIFPCVFVCLYERLIQNMQFVLPRGLDGVEIF